MARKKGKHPAGPPKIAVEGVGAEALGSEEEGHVIVVTDFGLAMLVAGLRSIKYESPEVEPLLDTLEKALAEGIDERLAKEALEREALRARTDD